MAHAEELLIQEIEKTLENAPEGLSVDDIIIALGGGSIVSSRGVRNLLNELVKTGNIIKRKRRGKGPGAPSFSYFHPKSLTAQLSFFDEIMEIKKYSVITKSEVEEAEIEQDELDRQRNSHSVLTRIASGHLQQENYARAVLKIAASVAEINPIDLVLQMSEWVVNDINHLGNEVRNLTQGGKTSEAEKLASELNWRIGWARRYFQRFWRFDHGIDDHHKGILELPGLAREFIRDKDFKAEFNVQKAKSHLEKRIMGDSVISKTKIPLNLHNSAASSDASVADIYLDHTQGSFIPPDPIVVITAAAALRTHAKDGIFEYQDFDIYPDQLKEYEDHAAAVKGLVISPLMKQILPEDDFKHTRLAAMDLRQYWEDMRVTSSEAEWRPIGISPTLGITPRPTLLFRDGRIFPLVHRLKDFEDDGLYGQIVRRQTEKFADVCHNILSGPRRNTIYAAAVKSPELSWLAPIIFWYIHSSEVQFNGEVVISDYDVYRPPFSDTAISHLLFLGLMNTQKETIQEGDAFVTFRAIRRFSDIAIEGEDSIPISLIDGDIRREIDENNEDDWQKYIHDRLVQKKGRRENLLEQDEYQSFIYLCAKLGVSSCYAAPSSAYFTLNYEDAGHFLLPRLEIAIEVDKPKESEKKIEGMLSWLVSDGCELDRAHTQSAFDTGNEDQGLPILVPDVNVLAHEAVTFARDQLGEEVQDEIRALVMELRKRAMKPR